MEPVSNYWPRLHSFPPGCILLSSVCDILYFSYILFVLPKTTSYKMEIPKIKKFLIQRIFSVLKVQFLSDCMIGVIGVIICPQSPWKPVLWAVESMF